MAYHERICRKFESSAEFSVACVTGEYFYYHYCVDGVDDRVGGFLWSVRDVLSFFSLRDGAVGTELCRRSLRGLGYNCSREGQKQRQFLTWLTCRKCSSKWATKATILSALKNG